MADILIAGCGYVGTALGLRLNASGHRVWGLRRSSIPLPERLETVQADLVDLHRSDLPQRSFDTVFYLAGAGQATEAAYRDAYVSGVRNLVRAFGDRLETLRRFVFASSTRVFSQESGEWVDETSAASGDDFRARRLLEGEATVSALAIPTTRVRFGGIYGPGRERLLQRLSVEPRGAAAETYTNRIHRDDAAGFLAHLLEADPIADLYLGVDSEPAKRITIHHWLRGQEPKRDDRPGNGKRCSNSRLLESGYSLLFPSFREGYAGLVAPESSL